MKPRVELKQEAVVPEGSGWVVGQTRTRPCIILIDGIPFCSDSYLSEGFTTIQINTAARRLVEAMKL